MIVKDKQMDFLKTGTMLKGKTSRVVNCVAIVKTHNDSGLTLYITDTNGQPYSKELHYIYGTGYNILNYEHYWNVIG